MIYSQLHLQVQRDVGCISLHCEGRGYQRSVEGVGAQLPESSRGVSWRSVVTHEPADSLQDFIQDCLPEGGDFS